MVEKKRKKKELYKLVVIYKNKNFTNCFQKNNSKKVFRRIKEDIQQYIEIEEKCSTHNGLL